MPGKDGTGPDGNGPKKNNTGIPTPRRRRVVNTPKGPGKRRNKGGTCPFRQNDK